jgi:hypothetical protein
MKTIIDSWIEYLAFFIPLHIILFKGLVGFSLRTKMFEVYEISELPPDKLVTRPLQTTEVFKEID